MEKAPNGSMSTMSFGGLEEEQKYKRLQRLMKQAHKGQCFSGGRNDFEKAEVSLSISSIAPESNDSLQTRQLFETSKTGSYVIASSNNRGRMHVDGLTGKNGTSRQPLAKSSVKDYLKPREKALASPPGQNHIYDRTSEISNLSSYSENLSPYGKPVANYSQRGVGARFARWTIMLNEQGNLLIKGNLISGSYCQSKPVLRKVSAKIVQTINKCLYTLAGNINDENHELPSYVRGKFYDGFPDDWENVHQVWLAFDRQGSPLNFRWPTDLADSDDDLRSEVTDDTVECHLRNLPECNHEFSQIEADCSALSREPLSFAGLPTAAAAAAAAAATTTTALERNGAFGQQSREKNDSDKRAQPNHIPTDNVASVSSTANLGVKSINFAARPESNQTVDIREEIDALYKNFLTLFDRLRLTYFRSEEATSLHLYEEASSPGKMTIPRENNGLNQLVKNGDGARGEEATSPMPIGLETSAIESNVYEAPERVAETSVNSDELESEMYAGVRKMPVGIVLSHRNTRHRSNERKRPTLTRRKSRDTYARRTGRISTVSSSVICGTEGIEGNKGENEGASASLNKYGEEYANSYRRPTSAGRMPLSRIDGGMNVELNTTEFKTMQQTSTSEVGEQWSMSMPSRCAPGRRDGRDVAATPNSAVVKKSEHLVESFNPNCQLTSTKTSQTIDRESRIPAGSAQHLIPADQLARHRTVAPPSLETAANSSRVTVAESPAKRNEPVPVRVSTRKSDHLDANATGNDALRDEEQGGKPKEKEILKIARLSKEKVKGQVTTAQLLKSWLPRVVRKSPSDLNGDLIFHGELINAAGHLLRSNVATSSVRRRLSRSRIETVDSQVYQLVGEMHDPRNTVPRALLTQCRYGCPTRIEDFCKAWLAATLPTMKGTKLAAAPTPPRAHDASMERLNVSVSSKGRRILPPLSYWTGERVLLKDNNPVYSPGIVADIKEAEKKEGTASRHRAGASSKRTLSTSADSNDERSPPSTNKRRRISSRVAASEVIPAEPSKPRATATGRSNKIIHLSRMGRPPHRRARTVKLLDASLSEQEELDDASPVTTAPAQKLRKARGRLTPRGTTSYQAEENATENPHAGTISSVDRCDDTRRESLPNLNSSTVKRRWGKVSYNLYKNCPSQQDALSDDELSHV